MWRNQQLIDQTTRYFKSLDEISVGIGWHRLLVRTICLHIILKGNRFDHINKISQSLKSSPFMCKVYKEPEFIYVSWWIWQDQIVKEWLTTTTLMEGANNEFISKIN